MLAHTVLYSEATRNIDAEFSSEHVRSPTEKSNYQFKRSKSLLVELTKWLFSVCVCVVHLSDSLVFRWKPESAVCFQTLWLSAASCATH